MVKGKTFVKELPGNNEEHTKELHTWRSQYYVVSRIIALDHEGWETMIFSATKDGEVTDWKEIYEHRGYETIKESIATCLSDDLNYLD